MWITVATFLILLIPISEAVVQILQYILSKNVKPKLIPKMEFYSKIPEDEATFVIIPTIVDSKKKVEECFKNLEVDYLANKTDNLYFCLLGDCKQENTEVADYDNEVMLEGTKQVEILNKKYPKPLILPQFSSLTDHLKYLWSELGIIFLECKYIKSKVYCVFGIIYKSFFSSLNFSK